METLSMWPRYLAEVAGTTSRKEIASKMSEVAPRPIAASTITRWFTGKHKPTDAAHVALFALAYGRSPLEAFVAARLLDLGDAAAGLEPESLELLARVQQGGSTDPDADEE